MADKPEIFLEIGAGFFRIPTSEANYNITVIGQPVAGQPQPAPVPAAQPTEAVVARNAEPEGNAGDDYYRIISEDLYGDIGQLAKSLSSTIMEIPAEDRKQKRASLDEAGDKIEDAKGQLKDIVSMTEKAAMEIMDSVELVQGESGDVRQLLDDLKNHAAFNNSIEAGGEGEEEAGDEAGAPALAPLLEEVRSGLTEIGDEVDAMLSETPDQDEPEPAKEVEKKKRYLFVLDVIFQTLYELCTNETVKEHITSAREKADEIFELATFQDAISVRAEGYEADSDNYFNVPMSDVFQTLFAACADKGIKNLLKKMDQGQSTIFLDQAIPLEVPEIAEVEVEVEGGETTPPPATEPDPRLAPLQEKVTECSARLAAVEEAAGSMAVPVASGMTLDDQQEIFDKIENAFGVARSITQNVTKITEALSFQDLSGQRIMKIIKLLSDFQIQLLGIVVSFGSQLKHRQEDTNLSVQESKEMAQADVDKYLGGVLDDEKHEPLDQDTVNTMLEEMGF